MFTGNGSKDRDILHQMSLSLAASIYRRCSFRAGLEDCPASNLGNLAGVCLFIFLDQEVEMGSSKAEQEEQPEITSLQPQTSSRSLN